MSLQLLLLLVAFGIIEKLTFSLALPHLRLELEQKQELRRDPVPIHSALQQERVTNISEQSTKPLKEKRKRRGKKKRA